MTSFHPLLRWPRHQQGRPGKIAQGRVWTGSKAKELGLVDELGDPDKAFETLPLGKSRKDYKVKSYPKKDFLTEVLNTPR